MITCILLAAGFSQRFGSPKALAPLKTQTVIELLLETLIASDLDQIIVVLGAQADEIKAHILNHTKVKVVYNKDYNLGQTSSFKAGVKEISDDSDIMLLPVDCPFIVKETLNKLIKYFSDKTLTILIPTHKGKKGHPPIFSATFKPKFLAMDNNTGINSFEGEYLSSAVLLPIQDPGIIKSFNTKEEFDAIKGDL